MLARVGTGLAGSPLLEQGTDVADLAEAGPFGDSHGFPAERGLEVAFTDLAPLKLRSPSRIMRHRLRPDE